MHSHLNKAHPFFLSVPDDLIQSHECQTGSYGNHRNGTVKNEVQKWILLRKQTLSRSVACKQDGGGTREAGTDPKGSFWHLKTTTCHADEVGFSKGQEEKLNPTSFHTSTVVTRHSWFVVSRVAMHSQSSIF